MTLNPGDVLNNRYRIVKLLGQGGFGAVYRAWDMNLESARALKENLSTSTEAQRQFKREAQILDKLSHPNLTKVIDHFIIPDQGQYLVMEFVEGQDLQEMVNLNGGPLPETQVLPWISQICDALGYLHSQDPPIIHRDIKPANIKITPQGRAMLVDFGIAKVFDSSMQTTIGARALTPGYAPPEQYGKGKTDARTDLYALGATLYTVLTGEEPLESVQRAVQDDLIPPEKLNPKLSTTSLSSILMRALEMNPNLRFQSAAEFKNSLQSKLTPELVSLHKVGAGMVAPTMAAPTQTTATQAIPEQALSTQFLKKWGWLAGFAGLIMVGIVVFSIAVFSVFNRAIKPDSTQTLHNATTSGISETMAATESSQKTSKPDTNGTPPSKDQATSTMFVPADKPTDIPIMQGAKDFQVWKSTQADKDMLSVYFTIEATNAEIIAYYEREMSANGWSKTGDYEDSSQLLVYFSKENRMTMLILSKTVKPTMVNLTIMQK
jgi:hypothetical protein